MRIITGLLLIVASFFIYANEPKVNEDLNTVHALSPKIYDVKGMGEWQEGSRKGQVRLVITRTAKQDSVFIQWVQWGKSGPQEILYTTHVKEIKDAGRFKVTFIRREMVPNQEPRMVLGLENKYDKSMARAHIWLTEVGHYRCEVKS
ncbi:hypothetical protein [Bermanella sp. R86510]|uniref:hypothetical protein n=1 Tax=unclassified Bermanella TaxID=2627862 RepID=UPI0037C4F7CE